jgi:hypothetical protein
MGWSYPALKRRAEVLIKSLRDGKMAHPFSSRRTVDGETRARILVMKAGRIIAEFSRQDASEQAIMRFVA